MRRELYLLVVVQILVASSMGIVGPIYSIYFERISGNLKDVGLLVGVYWIIVGLLEVPFGMLSDRIGKKKVFTIGGMLVSLSILLYSMVSNFKEALIVEMMGAVGYSMQMPAFYSLMAEVTRKEKRGLEVGLVDSSWNLFYGLASIISGILVVTFGFSLIFSLASFLYFGSSILIGGKMREIR